ncbi:MAG: riboflavin synthase [Alphaproteobacteria bacterium]|nr:riboflavin synthase [Alphaproteobacteria bacterium]
MFTGLIQDIGIVQSLEKASDWRIRIGTALDTAAMTHGASVCCAGCCLTVIDKGPGWFDVQVSSETLDKTNIGSWSVGRRFNLEPSLKLGDELGGHFVFGHVDGLARLVSRRLIGESQELLFTVPPGQGAFVAPKGSVALDGVSLTVNAVHDTVQETQISVMIIPHTAAHTTLGDLQPGDSVNFEADMLARYVARQAEVQCLTRRAA